LGDFSVKATKIKFLFYFICIVILGYLSLQSCKPVQMTQLPQVELKDLEGRTVRLQDFQGKPLIVNFWATWCGPCRHEIPMLNDLQKKYATSGLVIIAISVDEDGAAAVKPFMNEVPIHYTNLRQGPDTVEKFGGLLGYPTNFFYDRTGKQVSKVIGLQQRSFFESEIQKIIQ
jgi:thiol-disulfide isomerase/thioredoxin